MDVTLDETGHTNLCDCSDYLRKGTFPFVRLPRGQYISPIFAMNIIQLTWQVELRDLVYEYARPYAKSIQDHVVNVMHLPVPDFEFTGLISVSRQIHDEWKSRNPRSRNVSLYLMDVNDYIQTFQPSAVGERRTLRVTNFAQFVPWNRKSDLPIIDLTALIELSMSDPNLEVSFNLTNVSSKWSANDLTCLLTTLVARHALASLYPARPIADSTTPASSGPASAAPENRTHLLRLPLIPAHISRVKTVWSACEDSVNSEGALIFMFDPSRAAPWMYGDWMYITNIKAMMSGLEHGDIPPEYLSEEEHLRCTFWKSLSLQELSPWWKIWIGVEGQDSVQLSRPGRLGLGWVWDNDEAEELSDCTCDDDFVYLATEDEENDAREERAMQEESESEDGECVSEEQYWEYEEEDIDGEDLAEELAWLRAPHQEFK